MIKKLSLFTMVVLVVTVCTISAAGNAKVTQINGNASLLRKGSEEWKPIRPNMPLAIGDQVYSREESFVEITYPTGAVLRMDENTKIVIMEASEKSSKTRSGVGNVWVNMQKLVSSGKEFEISTPTATAAIRGTVFHMSTAADSSTDVSVFRGKVSVGPSSELKKKLDAGKKSQQQSDELGPGEVPGPEEVPGPYEVSLEEWRMIVAGQKISVRKDGKYAQEEFDSDEDALDAFMKMNMDLDKKLPGESK